MDADMQKEAAILYKLKHEHIIKMHGVCYW